MAEIVKTYRQQVPALRFVGKKYGDEDRVNGGFGKQWCEWFANGWFVEAQAGSDSKSVYEDSDATIGLMRWKEGEPFQYWIGVFCPEHAQVPKGFGFVDFPQSELGVAWVSGKDGEIYGQEHRCAESCKEQGYEIIPDDLGAYWVFERYVCPRFTASDEHGNIVLDICHFIDKS